MWWILDSNGLYFRLLDGIKEKERHKEKILLTFDQSHLEEVGGSVCSIFPEQRIKIMEDNYVIIRHTHIHTCLQGSQRRGSSLTLERQE